MKSYRKIKSKKKKRSANNEETQYTKTKQNHIKSNYFLRRFSLFRSSRSFALRFDDDDELEDGFADGSDEETDSTDKSLLGSDYKYKVAHSEV